MYFTCNIKEAADILKVHPNTVLELIAACILPAGKIGKSYVIMASDIHAHVAQVIAQQTAKRMGGQPLPRRVHRRSLTTSC
jgi:excisionase family DNA binding protein